MATEAEINLDSLMNSLNSVGDDPSKFNEESKFLDIKLEKALKIAELKTAEEFNSELKQNRSERKKYAKWIFILTAIWTSLIFIIIVASGLKEINGKAYFLFSLSDKVIITLITSTTINIFGFFLLVVKFLFNTNELTYLKDKKETGLSPKKPIKR